MQQLTNGQRQYLRRMAHQIRPLVQVGKQGMTAGVQQNVDRALDDHELIKVKFLAFQDERDALLDDLVRATACILVDRIGNIATLYRQQSDPDRQKLDLPR